MNPFRSLIDRMRAIHWLWWTIWFISIALLGLTIATHHTGKVSEMAESFRYPWGLLPIHILAHRNLAEGAGYTMALSMVLVIVAVSRPTEAPVLVPIAIGLALLFFAFHTLLYSQMMTMWMKAEVLKRGSVL